MKGEFEGKYNIVFNDRDVEMDLYACIDCEGDVDDVDIHNAHYVDNDKPIEPELIEKAVRDSLSNEEWEFWGYGEDTDTSEMDCVDVWRYSHGEEF